jgi:membrane carboxypeptidase/penicillin-binding protein PbpC
VTGAGPIFHDVMLAAVEHVLGRLPIGDTSPIVAAPSDVHRVTLCAESGLAPNAWCPTHVVEWLPSETVLAQCDWHRAGDTGVVTVYPEPFRVWAKSAGLRTDTPAVATQHVDSPRRAAPIDSPPTNALVVVAPLAGALYLIDPTLRPEYQTLPLRARGATGTLAWFVDGAPIGTALADDAVRWPLARGTHAIKVKDAAGRTAETSITVR